MRYQIQSILLRKIVHKQLEEKRNLMCIFVIDNILQMIEIQKHKEYDGNQIQKILESKEPILAFPSEICNHSKVYKQFFDGVEVIYSDKLANRLQQQKIRYSPQRDHKIFNIQSKQASFSNQIVTLLVEIGPFDIEISLYNNINKNYAHFLKGKASTFATIYEYSASEPQSVIKCTAFKPKDFLDTLVNIVKQYAFLKIAGILGVGPQATQTIGFDLIAYVDCIQFSMEKCLPLSKFDETTANIIKEKLKRLHQFQIVHADIKPQNFCLSPSLNEPIFIDFGLSEILSQRPGEATHTFFMGSLSYCCKEMNKLYYESTSGLVDLYYNDTICMANSFAQMAQEVKAPQEINFLKEDNHSYDSNSQEEIDAYPSGAWIRKVVQNFTLLKVKYLIYSGKPIETWFSSYEHSLMSNKDTIFMFINTLQYSDHLSVLCQKLSSNDKNKYQIDNRLKMLRRNIFRQDQLLRKGNQSKEGNEYNEKPTFLSDFSDQEMLSLVSSRMQELQNGLEINSVNTSKKQFMIDLNVKTLLQSNQLISKLERLQYFRKFAIFTDLRKGFGFRCHESATISIMLDYIKMGSFKDKQMLEQLGCCWDFILKYFLDIETPYNLQVIPALYHSLSIIEHYSLQELLKILYQIGSLQVKSNIYKFQLFYQCFTAIYWTLNRSITRYNLIDFKEQIGRTIYHQIEKLLPHIRQGFIRCVYYLILSATHKYRKTEELVQLIAYLQQNESYLSNETYFDMRITFLAALFENQNRFRLEDIYSKILDQYTKLQNNLKYKYRFNHYHFQLYRYALQISNKPIKKALMGNFYLCFDHLRLLNCFSLAASKEGIEDHQSSYKEFIRKLQRLDPSSISNHFEGIFEIDAIIAALPPQVIEDHQIVELARQKITFTFIMSIQIGDLVKLLDIWNYFRAYLWLFSIFCRVNRGKAHSQFSQQLARVYQKVFIDYYKIQSLDTSLFIFRTVRQITPKYLIQLGDFKNALNQYCHFIEDILAIQPHKMVMHYFYWVFHILNMRKEIERPFYVGFLYSAWRKHHEIIHLFEFPKESFIYLFSAFMRLRNDIDELLTIHLLTIKSIQQSLSETAIDRYILQTYVMVSDLPQLGRVLIERIKTVSKENLRQWQSYTGVIVLLIIICLEERYDAESDKILRLCLPGLSSCKGVSRSLLHNMLYRYLIVRETGFNPITKPLMSFQLDPKYLQDIKDSRNRQIAFWLHRMVKFRQLINKLRFPIEILIKNYNKYSNYHKMLKNFLEKIGKNI